MSEIKMMRTPRGFVFCEFTDRYGTACTLQKSSLATEDASWLGSGGGPGRMHLTQDHVRALLPLLQHFAETGDLPDVPA